MGAHDRAIRSSGLVAALRLPHVRLQLDAARLLLLRLPPREELLLLERPPDQEALGGLAPVILEEGELRARLHAFGDHAQAERVRQRDDRLRDRHAVSYTHLRAHE